MFAILPGATKAGRCSRAGLLATQGIRGGANREVLKRILTSGGIFWAESDRPWILDGANVHVSMVGFDGGSDETRTLDGTPVLAINANLTATQDTTHVEVLQGNQKVAFQGPVRVGDFDISSDEAARFLQDVNPHGRPNSDVLRPTLNGTDNVKRPRERWVVDFDGRSLEDAVLFEAPFRHVRQAVYPARQNSRDPQRRRDWWLHGRSGDEMRRALAPVGRCTMMAQTAKFLLFRWHSSVVSPEQTLIVFARSDDLFFGVLHSRFHEVWALAQGTQLREKESGFRYTPTTCFETFPFPPGVLSPGGERAVLAEIAAAAKDLNDLRERWLNPPEWTRTETLTFPGTVGGPWDRFIDPATAVDRGGFRVGTVRYPRTVPPDVTCAERLKARTLTKLYNERPAWLDHAHRRLDAAVAAAYGWPADLSDDAILERLLALNSEQAK